MQWSQVINIYFVHPHLPNGGGGVGADPLNYLEYL